MSRSVPAWGPKSVPGPLIGGICCLLGVCAWHSFIDPELGDRAARKLDRRRRPGFDFVQEGRFQKQAEMQRLKVIPRHLDLHCPVSVGAVLTAQKTARCMWTSLVLIRLGTLLALFLPHWQLPSRMHDSPLVYHEGGCLLASECPRS